MRAGIAAGRALVSSLHRIALKPQLPCTSFSSSNLLPKSSLSLSSIAPVFRVEYHGLEFGLTASSLSSSSSSSSSLWSQSSTAAFSSSHVTVDGYRRSPLGFSASDLETASIGCFKPTAQNPVLLQGLATLTSTQTFPTRTPTDAKASADTKTSSGNKPSPLSPPSPPPPGVNHSSEKPKTKSTGVIKQTLLDFGAVPFPALLLGIAGLIPFVALAPPLAHMLPLPDILAAGHADAQAAYGASILSFLGAIHWGLAMADYAAPGKGGVANMTLMTSRYIWSVVPSLMAWTALLLPPTAKFALLIFSLWMVFGVDFLFARLKLVPYWFLSLRWPLTFIATVSMVPSMLAAATWA